MITIEKLQEAIRATLPLQMTTESGSGAIHLFAEEHLGNMLEYGTTEQIVYLSGGDLVWETHCKAWQPRDLDAARLFAMEWMDANFADTVVVSAEMREMYWRRTMNVAFLSDDCLLDDDTEDEKDNDYESFAEAVIYPAKYDGIEFFRKAQSQLGG